MKKRLIIIALIALTAIPLTGCLTRKSETTETQSTTSDTSLSSTYDEKETEDNATISDTMYIETSDVATQEAILSPFDFPYDKTGIHSHLEDYADNLGMVYNGSLTMEQARSVTKIETRAAATGNALQSWCEDEIKDILSLAKTCGYQANDVNYYFTIIESSKYDCEYEITIYSKY